MMKESNESDEGKKSSSSSSGEEENKGEEIFETSSNEKHDGNADTIEKISEISKAIDELSLELSAKFESFNRRTEDDNLEEEVEKVLEKFLSGKGEEEERSERPLSKQERFDKIKEILEDSPTRIKNDKEATNTFLKTDENLSASPSREWTQRSEFESLDSPNRFDPSEFLRRKKLEDQSFATRNMNMKMGGKDFDMKFNQTSTSDKEPVSFLDMKDSMNKHVYSPSLLKYKYYSPSYKSNLFEDKYYISQPYFKNPTDYYSKYSTFSHQYPKYK